MSTGTSAARRDVPLLRELVDVRRRPTVVRLEHLDEADSGWITACYHITPDVKNHLAALAQVLARPHGCGAFLIGQYGSGKSHFLAYLLERLRAGDLVAGGPAPVAVSLLNFRAEVALEDIIRDALGLNATARDRRHAWSALAQRYPAGLILLIDELSEFLRSKPDGRSYNEDVRFLQFLGEWAQGQRFWVLGAMQEEIEHTGALEHGIYRKIKDRYPLRFLLTPAHLRELIADSILVKKAGYEAATTRLIGELRRAFPSSPVDYDQLASIYPLHPATLDVLEEVRDRFSQARGIVDFAVTQLVGDPARGVSPFLDRPWGSLLCPDAIVDHFQDLFELQAEFQPIAQQLLPYYRKHLDRLFPQPALRELAWRLLKLLVLVHLAPGRRGLSVEEAVHWLQYRVTRLDPNKNVHVVARACGQLADEGRYVARRGAVYALQLDDDGGAALEKFLQRTRAELEARGSGLFDLLAPLLPADGFHPFGLPQDAWQQRTLRWHFHERPYALYAGGGQPPKRDGTTLCIRLPWGTTAPAAGHFSLVPRAVQPGPDHVELAALAAARQRSWDRDLAARLETRFHERLRLFGAAVKNAYLDASIVTPSGEEEPVPSLPATESFVAWVERLVQWILKRTYPSFETFAPTHGPLPKEALRAWMRFVSEQDIGEPTSDPYVQLIREAYLVPMKLLRRQGRGYVCPKHLERNELVRALRILIDCQPAPPVVYDHLAQPVYGLVPDQVSILLILLVILGEIDILKDRRSYRDAFETLPLPVHYDRIVPGTALGMEQLRQLTAVCEALSVRVPAQWTVLAQRRTARELREVGRTRGQPLEALLLKLREIGQTDALSQKIRGVLSRWAALEKGDSELDGLQQFLYEIDSPRQFAASMTELEGLPAKIDRLLRELERLRHLLGHPAVAQTEHAGIAGRVDTLGPPPALDQSDALDQWLQSARTLYAEYQEDYRRRHQAWWETCGKHALWRWQPDPLARSRHIGLERELDELQACRERATRRRCQGLVNLEFQPVCNCGFDGQSSPIAAEFERFAQLRETIDKTTVQFFAQDAVRTRLRKWLADGLEANPRTRAYVDGKAPCPEVSNLKLLDDYLGGVELVEQVDAGVVFDLLEQRTWNRRALLAALDKLLARFGAARLRFTHTAPDADGQLARWCLQRALHDGVPLPPGLPADALRDAADAVQPGWVGRQALARLECLGLGPAVVDRVLQWVADGQLAIPAATDVSPLVFAARDLQQPSTIENPAQLADVATRLYTAHPHLLRIAGDPYLTRLDQLARTELAEPAEDLAVVLRRHLDAQWLVVDCLGLPLLAMLREQLPELLPGWRLARQEFARVSSQTTTDAFYRDLLDANFQRSLEKTNVVDRILHERFLPLPDFARIAAAELRIALRPLRQRLRPDAPLLVFADHGFRIAADGRSFVHGGTSNLERIVPVLRLEPV